MEDEIKVIAADFDTLEVERVFIVDTDGRPELRAVVSRVLCHVDSKPRLIAAGLVCCFPLDPEINTNWPAYADLEIGGVRDRYWGIVQVPRLAEAARRFYALLEADEARPGMEL